MNLERHKSVSFYASPIANWKQIHKQWNAAVDCLQYRGKKNNQTLSE